MSFVDFLANGISQASGLVMLGYFFVATFCTVLAVTIYLHRHQAHRAVDMHPLVTHPMRFWLWLTTAMVTKEWVAIHRKHHAFCETDEDPHSPNAHGIGKVVFDGVDLYRKAKSDAAMMDKFGEGTPDDWLERNLYSRKPTLGVSILLFASFVLFGFWGVAMWALQMIWIPFFAAGVINGLGHWWGYRNFATRDRSTNISPIGFFLGGEELHNNHHAFASSAKFALRRYEFDIGWVVLRALAFFKLAKILRVAPSLAIRPNIDLPDAETLKAVLAHKCNVMGNYCREVTLPALKSELAARGESLKQIPRRWRRALADQGRWLQGPQRESLNQWIASNALAESLMHYRARLDELMESRQLDMQTRLEALKQWCRDAEASGIAALELFAKRLRGYALA